jgi:hypothetical protein
MTTQTAFYNLRQLNIANFWSAGGASARRALIVQQPSTSEFLAFGVLLPSNTLHFMVRGQLDQMTDFVARMKKDGAEVVPLTQRETEEPPPLPNFTFNTSLTTDIRVTTSLTTDIRVTLRGAAASNETVSFTTAEQGNGLWPSGSDQQNVILVPVPNSSTESLAFGLCELSSVTNDLWEVAFVARMNNADREAFKSEMAQDSISVEERSSPLQLSLQKYLQDNFGSPLYMSAAGVLQGPSSNDARFTQVAA